MKEFLLKPFENEKDIVVTVPGSKSITNRALLLAALSNGKKRLRKQIPCPRNTAL